MEWSGFCKDVVLLTKTGEETAHLSLHYLMSCRYQSKKRFDTVDSRRIGRYHTADKQILGENEYDDREILLVRDANVLLLLVVVVL